MAEATLFETDETLTVGQLNRRLSELIKRNFAHELWVQGQIRNLSRSNRGHVYFDLVDPVAAGAAPKTSISVTLFDSNRQIVNRVITRTGNNMRIDDGVEVRIRASVDFYAPRGQLQLNMTSIDPDFTIGRLGADRERLLAQLRDEDLIEANRQIPLPLVPLRVALITSGGSAAHADFTEQIADSGYAFELTELTGRVQGEFASEEIAERIDAADRLPIDVIAIVRGGGARTDLATFDTEPIARAICGATVPVICGIGHETDSSVADLVASVSLKTPTACAQFLIERVVTFDFGLAERAERLAAAARVLPMIHAARIEQAADEVVSRSVSRLTMVAAANATAGATLTRHASDVLHRAERRLDTAAGSVEHLTRVRLASADRRAALATQRLVDLAPRTPQQQTQRLALLEARLSAVDPAQALKRGYSITTDADGNLVRSISDVSVGTELVTRLNDGTITSETLSTTPASTRRRGSSEGDS